MYYFKTIVYLFINYSDPNVVWPSITKLLQEVEITENYARTKVMESRHKDTYEGPFKRSNITSFQHMIGADHFRRIQSCDRRSGVVCLTERTSPVALKGDCVRSLKMLRKEIICIAVHVIRYNNLQN